MIRELRIQNLILVEQARVVFDQGFHAFTGETGAGKSALLSAIILLLGQRVDSGVVRSGTEKAVIEGFFDLPKESAVWSFLREAGIDCDTEELLIHREITACGKSQQWINHQRVQQRLLKGLAPLLMIIVSQHANHELFLSDRHRLFLDRYSSLEELKGQFQNRYRQCIALQKKIEEWKRSEGERLREASRLRSEMEEIFDASCQEEEDASLYQEYTRLTHGKEVQKILHGILTLIQGGRSPLIPLLSGEKEKLQQWLEVHPELQEVSGHFQTAILELQEGMVTLRNIHGKVESNPYRLEEVNERLSLIEGLKKKYGPTLPEVISYGESAALRLEELEDADDTIEELEKQLIAVKKEVDNLATQLTTARGQGAKEFQKILESELHLLNMVDARVELRLTPQQRSSEGDEQVEIYLAPNKGERIASLKECASGGEISRVVLALYTTLSGKANIPTLLFDEVDANIGGKTAALVGQKLLEISKKHQLLCVTHFPQVARFAEHHYRVSKAEENGRTYTEILTLDEEGKQDELMRMIGGEELVSR